MAIQKALQEGRKDEFTPNEAQLLRFATRKEGGSGLHDSFVRFLLRCDIVATAFDAHQVLPRTQGKQLFASLHAQALSINRQALALWREQARQVHQTACELLQDEQALKNNMKQKTSPPRIVESIECVICQDESVGYRYEPCGHEVACKECAKAYWLKSASCPWCRAEVKAVV